MADMYTVFDMQNARMGFAGEFDYYYHERASNRYLM